MRKTPFTSSTGTKILLALTGLALIGYLVLHLAGNLMFFAGPETFNGYSHLLVSNPLIYPVEIGLGLIFLLHIYKAVTNFRANRNARPTAYHKKEWAGGPSRKTVSSTTMIYTGLFLLLFVILHLMHFRFGENYEMHTAAGHTVRDLHRLEVNFFSRPLNVAFYVVSMIIIAFHLWHGFWSSFQSLGLGNARFTPKLVMVGRALTAIIAGGFIFIPIWIYFTQRPAAETSAQPPQRPAHVGTLPTAGVR